MANNSYICKLSSNIWPDAENPPFAINNATGNNNNSSTKARSDPCPSSKAVKLGIVVLAVSVAVVLVVALARNGFSNTYGVRTSTTSESSIALQNPASETYEEINSPGTHGETPMKEAEVEPKPDAFQSITSEYYISDGPLQARVKMVSPSILNGYETCYDLERDIVEALKLYMNDFIVNEAVMNEEYATCDPENENWHSDADGYFYYDHQYFYEDTNYTCSITSNHTTCATDNAEVPWVVTWHVLDLAEGELFCSETEARESYDNVNSSLAKRLYDPSKTVVDEYGFMDVSEWCQLDTWAYEAQCHGKMPTSLEKKNPTKKVTKLLRNKPSRSRLSTRTSRANSEMGDSYDQNSQNDRENEQDKILSDGTYIYAAYGDVIYTWAPADATQGISITSMTEELPENECDPNSTEGCTSTTKPSIRALFIGDSRLTVIVSQTSWNYPIPKNYTFPIITDFATKAYVFIYDISEVTLGFPLKEIGRKELVGDFLDGRSIGSHTLIATVSYIDASVFTKDLTRSRSQYCGLDSASYKALAAETALKQVESFAKQMVAELKLASDCSKIFQISMMTSSIEEPNLTGADLLGSFVHVSMFNASTDFGLDDDTPLTFAGAFTAGYGQAIYLDDDFLALPGHVFKYNDTSARLLSETFIFGFDLSIEDRATPFCYGHVPGALRDNYYMDKWGGLLRIVTSNQFITDAVNWTATYTHKIFVLELPNILHGPGKLSLIGETENLADKDGIISGVRFFEDRAYISANGLSSERNHEFIIVDLSNPNTPVSIGHLNTSGYFSYLQLIDIKSVPYILGVGYETEEMDGGWQMYAMVSLIDVSIPSSPKEITSFNDAGPSYDAYYDSLAVRYLPESNKLILPASKSEYNHNGIYNYTDGFVVYDVNQTSISPAFYITHSTTVSICRYNGIVPARSFVIQSELTTIQGHTAITTDMDSGIFISEIDLDVGFNYSVCDPWWYYDY